jgi:hypothetical protein
MTNPLFKVTKLIAIIKNSYILLLKSNVINIMTQNYFHPALFKFFICHPFYYILMLEISSSRSDILENNYEILSVAVLMI